MRGCWWWWCRGGSLRCDALSVGAPLPARGNPRGGAEAVAGGTLVEAACEPGGGASERGHPELWRVRRGVMRKSTGCAARRSWYGVRRIYAWDSGRARRATVEASRRGSVGRFYAGGGSHQAAGHEPHYAAPRLRRDLGRPHGDGFDVRHRQRLEPGDFSRRVLAGDRLDGVDQIRRATFDVCDAWVAGRVEIYAEATVAKGYAMLPNRCADRRANR